MAVVTRCTCGKQYSTKAGTIGRSFRCKACGREVEVVDPDAASGSEDDGAEAWMAWIRQGFAGGSKYPQLLDEMEAQGVPHDDAVALLDAVLAEKRAALREMRSLRAAGARGARGGSGAPGWLIWIGILVLVNVLSYVLDWPFWIY